MPDKHYVIIGNGAAANRAADVIRSGDAEGRISLVSDEFFPFYHRHLLSRYIMGEKDEEALVVRPPSYYKENRIRLRLGQRVVRVDFQNSLLYLKHMEKIRYTSLLLSVGAKARIPEIHYAYQEHFTSLKTLADARAIRERLPGIKRLLILGGDVISVRVAENLKKAGKEVLFMIDRGAFWPLELSDPDRRQIASALTSKGMKVISGDAVTGVSREKSGKYVVRTDHEELKDLGMVWAFFGYTPDVDFLLGSGLDIERGILVDECLKTNIPNVFAAGDCAQVYNPRIRNYWVSIGWPNAEWLGEVAAHNMLGEALCIKRPEPRTLEFEGVTVSTSWWKELEKGG